MKLKSDVPIPGQIDPPLVGLLVHCFRQNFHLDHSNAAIHCAVVRYSPLTFRLAEQISSMTTCDASRYSDVYTVMLDRGAYEEDAGR